MNFITFCYQSTLGKSHSKLNYKSKTKPRSLTSMLDHMHKNLHTHLYQCMHKFTPTLSSTLITALEQAPKLLCLGLATVNLSLSWANSNNVINSNSNNDRDFEQPVLVKHTDEIDTSTNYQLPNPNSIIPPSYYQNNQAQAGELVASNNALNSVPASGYKPHYQVASYQDKTIKVIKFHYNYPVVVALNQLNYFQFPFKALQIDTVANLKLIARGNTLMLAPNQAIPFTLIVSNKDNPQQQVTLTVIPNAIPSVSYNFIAPELLTNQTLLGKPNLSYDELVFNVTALIRNLAQLIQNNYHVGYATTARYSLDNFKFNPSQTLTSSYSSNLDLVNISNHQRDYKYPLITCSTHSFKVISLKTYQPTNYYFNGIRLRYLKLKNQSNMAISYKPQACLQANVIAASLVLSQPLVLPGQTLSLVIAEKVDD